MKGLISKLAFGNLGADSGEAGSQKGFTLIEIGLVLSIFAIAIIALYGLYANRTKPQSWAQAKLDTFNGVMSSLNICQGDRGGTYPAAAAAGVITTAATTSPAGAVSAYVGSASTDINTWTYQCVAAGTTMKIAIVDTATPSTDAQTMLCNKITNAYGAAVVTACTPTANTTTVTISGTTCS